MHGHRECLVGHRALTLEVAFAAQQAPVVAVQVAHPAATRTRNRPGPPTNRKAHPGGRDARQRSVGLPPSRPRSSRCRSICPDDACTGLVPHRAANERSDCIRSGLSSAPTGSTEAVPPLAGGPRTAGGERLFRRPMTFGLRDGRRPRVSQLSHPRPTSHQPQSGFTREKYSGSS